MNLSYKLNMPKKAEFTERMEVRISKAGLDWYKLSAENEEMTVSTYLRSMPFLTDEKDKLISELKVKIKALEKMNIKLSEKYNELQEYTNKL